MKVLKIALAALGMLLIGGISVVEILLGGDPALRNNLFLASVGAFTIVGVLEWLDARARARADQEKMEKTSSSADENHK